MKRGRVAHLHDVHALCGYAELGMHILQDLVHVALATPQESQRISNSEAIKDTSALQKLDAHVKNIECLTSANSMCP